MKEQVIELGYQNPMLREKKWSLKDKLEKAYEFMKQFVLGEMKSAEEVFGMDWGEG